MSALRTVAAWESTYDQHKLYANHYQLQFAKSVIGKDGQLTFNLVWQSENLAPRTTISWQPVYALNWTLAVPANGITVTIGGAWQPCAEGQSYDIQPDGTWSPSTGPAKPNFLQVGSNEYQYAQQGLHILVGIQNSDGDYDPIYIDPNVLPLNNKSWYQPKEEVQWWYQAGNLSSTMIAGASTPVQTYDMSAPNPNTNQYYVSTTYLWDSGVWTTSSSKPPVSTLNAFAREPQFIPELRKGLAPEGLEKDIASIVDTLSMISTLVINHTQDFEGPNPFAFLARVKWPGTVSIGIMTAGVTTISLYLLNRGYQVKVSKDEQGRLANFELNPPKTLIANISSFVGAVPQPVSNDWSAAVATDSKDGAINLGIGPDTNNTLANINPQKVQGLLGNQTTGQWNGIAA